MKVHELIKILENVSQELDIYVPSKLTENDYNFVYSAKLKLLTIDDIDTFVFVIDEV